MVTPTPISSLLRSAQNKQVTEFKQQFDSIMRQKIREKFDAKRREIAQSMFNK